MNRSFFLIGAGLLGACAHHVALPPQLTPPTNNAYYEAGRLEGLSSKQESVFDFYRRRQLTLAQELGSLRPHDGLLFHESRSIWLHGSLDPLRSARTANGPQISDLEYSDLGPWWWDVLSLEVGTRLLSSAESLGPGASNACLNQYAQAMANWAPADARKATLNPPQASSETPQVLLGIEHKEDAVSSGKEVSQRLSRAFAQALPTPESFVSAQELVSNKAYLLTTNTESSWELRVQEARPFSSAMTQALTGSTPAEPVPTTGCVRYLKVMKIYRPREVTRCLTSQGISYGLRSRLESLNTLRAQDFKSADQLTQHNQWMCAELARVHAQQMTSEERKRLGLIFATNPLLRFRMQRLADLEAAKIMTAYRALLLTAPSSTSN